MDTSHYSRLENPTIPLATQERLPRTNILHVVPITTHTHDRRKSIGKQEKKKRKEDNGKEKKEVSGHESKPNQ